VVFGKPGDSALHYPFSRLAVHGIGNNPDQSFQISNSAVIVRPMWLEKKRDVAQNPD